MRGASFNLHFDVSYVVEFDENCCQTALRSNFDLVRAFWGGRSGLEGHWMPVVVKHAALVSF